MTIQRQALLSAAVFCFTLAIGQRAGAQDEESEPTETGAEENEAAQEQPQESEASESEPVETERAEPEAAAPPAAPAPAFARVWLGFAGSLDVLFMPSGRDLCKLTESGAPANDVGAYCTNPDGSDFPARTSHDQNDALERGGSAGEIDGGITTGNLRVLFAADYAASSNFLIGTRLGYVFGTYPGSAAGKGFPWIDRNLHAELRGTYIFGKDPLARVGFAPLAFVAAGAGEFDAQLTRYVTLEETDGRRDRRPVNIWIVRGPWFVAAGAGTRYQFSPRVAFTAALRMNVVLGSPSVLLTAGPDIGVLYGF